MRITKMQKKYFSVNTNVGYIHNLSKPRIQISVEICFPQSKTFDLHGKK